MKLNTVIHGVCFFICLMLAEQTFAQENTVTGKITDATTGEGLPGVNILIRGTSAGAVTDIEGNFSLRAQPTDVLNISFVGYITREIEVGSQTVINVALEPDIQSLQEVVVIGYGEQKKEDVTGVVTAVNSESFNRGAIVSPDQLVTGKVAGVQITSNTGEPGGQTSIRIRGGTSVNASNEPLYVIDGVAIDNSPHNPGGFSTGRNPLNFLNPDDIETFTVLKDASAAAIYGSRGANGVIIITTKKGHKGSAGQLSYSGWVSIADAIDKVDVLNAGEFRSIVNEEAPFRNELLLNANTDWQAKILQQAVGQNHSLSFTGGAEHLGYRFSLGYLNQEGIVRTSETERLSFSAGFNQSLLDGDLILDVNVKGSATNDQFNDNGAIGSAISFAPSQPVFDVNSEFGGYWEWPVSFGNSLGVNPVSLIGQTRDEGETFRSIGNVQVEYKIPVLEGLSAKVNLGYDVTRGQRTRFIPFTLRSQVTDSGEVRNENLTRVSKLLETYLTYKRDIESISSSINFTAGYSYQDFRNEFPSSRAFTLNTNSFGPNNPTVGSQFEIFNTILENRLISVFGRLNYAFRDKYLLTLTVRRDGSSRFGPLNRWGTFPSAAFAWRIIDEPFINAGPVLDDLKLRVGWGITGNQEIGDYQFLFTYRPGDQFSRYQFGSDFVTTTRPNGADQGLKWEETESFNVGLDYGLFEGRFTGSLEYYYKKTDDLLFTVAVPAGTNLTNRILTNIGELENEGFEFAVNAIAIDHQDWRWDIGFNMAYNQNEITGLAGDDDPNFEGFETGGITGGVGNNIQRLAVGQPVNSFFVFQHLPDQNGRPRLDTLDYNEDGQRNDADIYADTNGDGEVNDLDKRFLGQPAPDWIFGLTSQLYYKNFDLNFTLRANVGNYVYNNVSSANGFRDLVNGIVPGNMHRSVLETGFKDSQFFSDYYIEDASFLRMDNITLGYTIPGLPQGMNLRIYGTIQNLFTLTDYSGLDPEIGNASNNDITPQFGIDNNLYPRARTFIIGASFGL